MKVLSCLGLLLLVFGFSMPVWAEESAGGSSEATAGQTTEGQTTKPAEQPGAEKPKQGDEEPSCSE